MDDNKQMKDLKTEDLVIEEHSVNDSSVKESEEEQIIEKIEEAVEIKEAVKEEDNPEAVENSSEKSMEESVEETVTEATEKKEEQLEMVEIPAESKEQPKEAKPKKSINVKKVLGITAGAAAVLIVVFYVVGVIYYNGHFYHNTTINGMDFSEATVKEVEQMLTKEVMEYNLMLQEREGVVEYIKGSDIELQLLFDSSFEELLKNQNPFAWVVSWFKDSEYTVGRSVQYNQEKLSAAILALKAMNEVLMIAPENAYVDWTAEKGYFANPGIKGTQIDKNILEAEIHAAVGSLADTLNLEEKNCYVPQQISETDERLVNCIAELNKYNQVVVTYNFNGQTEICNGDIIRTWLSLDENYGVIIDAEKAREYIDTLGDKYNTYKTTRQFTTHNGSTIEISKGDYGWRLNRADMTEDLVATVRQGGTHTKEPMWLQTANSVSAQDWGNTYVEINLSAQYLYFYKDGQVIVESNLVSGNVSAGHTTPGGIYSLKWKEKDRILRGQIQEDGQPEYETPVSFWMPFNGGIGMHDATWRGSFGGSIYKTNGSHGCINLPYSKAKAIYENISSGTPIICYY